MRQAENKLNVQKWLAEIGIASKNLRFASFLHVPLGILRDVWPHLVKRFGSTKSAGRALVDRLWSQEDLQACKHCASTCGCHECGRSRICVHNRQRTLCKDCGGGGICVHNRRRSQWLCLIQLLKSAVSSWLREPDWESQGSHDPVKPLSLALAPHSKVAQDSLALAQIRGRNKQSRRSAVQKDERCLLGVGCLLSNQKRDRFRHDPSLQALSETSSRADNRPIPILYVTDGIGGTAPLTRTLVLWTRVEQANSRKQCCYRLCTAK
jgi:hypothetical protein